jgi:hypothetical protein
MIRQGGYWYKRATHNGGKTETKQYAVAAKTGNVGFTDGEEAETVHQLSRKLVNRYGLPYGNYVGSPVSG